ncbi:hypothetical protein RYX36_003095 [Vicia faba]
MDFHHCLRNKLGTSLPGMKMPILRKADGNYAGLKYFGQFLRKFANLVMKDGWVLKIGFRATKKLEHE